MIKEVIKSVSGWREMILTELTDYLNAPTIDVVDDQLYTWAGIALLVGPVNAEVLRVALEQNGLGWVVHQLGGSGIQLSNPLTQQLLLSFHQNGVPGCLELAQVGLRKVSVWNKFGGPGLLNTDQVNQARTELILQEDKEAFFLQGNASYNQFIDAVNNWNGQGLKPKLNFVLE